MSKFYKEYFWKNGFPYGREAKEPVGVTYKIAADPYNKWVSVEKYTDLVFDSVLYDSKLIDFRKLQPAEHLAWEKVVVSEEEDRSRCLIRNQDDRALYLETHFFVEGACKECHVHSPHGILLSIQKIFRKKWGDPFDGVMLYDTNGQPVLCKKYLVDQETEEFTELLEEEWDFSTYGAILEKIPCN